MLQQSVFGLTVLLPTRTCLLFCFACLRITQFLLFLCCSYCFNPFGEILQRWLFACLRVSLINFLDFVEEGDQFVIFYPVDSIFDLKDFIFLKGRSLKLGKLILKQLLLLLAQFNHIPFDIAVMCFVLGHYLLRICCHLRLHVCKPLHEFKISSFLALYLVSQKGIFVQQHLVLGGELFCLFEEVEVVVALYVHSSIITNILSNAMGQYQLRRMNIFYFVSRWPRYSLNGRSDKILSNVETLLNIGHQVSLFSADTAAEESLSDIDKMPIEVVHVNGNRIAQSLSGASHKPDMVLFNSPEVEQMYSIFLYSKWNKCPRILELDRLEGVQQWRHNNFTPNPSFLHEYDTQSYPTLPQEKFSQAELGSILRSDYYFCGTDFVADYLSRNLKLNNYVLNSIGVPINEFISEVKQLQFREFRHRNHFAFLGGLNSPKNILMIDTLTKQLWPLIKKELKDAELHIYGSGYNKTLQGKKKEMEKSGIFLRGFLEETQELQKYKAVLYPLLHSCGGKGTISQAWFHHTPVVTTPIGAEGYFHQTADPRFSALQTGQSYSGFFKERSFSKEELAEQKQVKDYYASNRLSQSIRELTFGGLCDSFSSAQFAANAVRIYTDESLWKNCLEKSRKSLLKNHSELQLEVNLNFGLSQVELASYDSRRRKENVDQWSRYLKSKQAYSRLHEKRGK